MFRAHVFCPLCFADLDAGTPCFEWMSAATYETAAEAEASGRRFASGVGGRFFHGGATELRVEAIEWPSPVAVAFDDAEREG